MVLGGAREAGLPIEIGFVLADGGNGVVDAMVVATTIDPAGTTRRMPLFDHGSEIDTGAGDGHYARYALGTNIAGTYAVRIEANGLDAAGLPLSVSGSGSIELGPMRDSNGDGVADGLPAWYGPGAGDFDLDGTTTAAELAAGSDPTISDTDEGGEGDGSELAAGRNPLMPDDDTDVPDILLKVRLNVDRRVEVVVMSRDETARIHVFRASYTSVDDLGVHTSSPDALTDGPLAAGTYWYFAYVELPGGIRGVVEMSDEIVVP